MATPPYQTDTQLLGERPGSFAWASVRQEFAPSATRIQSAARLALGCTLALVLAFLFNWTPVSNAMIPPLLLNRPDARYDLQQSLWTIASTAVMGMFFYWTLNFSQNVPTFALVLGGGLLLHGALTTLPKVGPSLSIGQVITSSVLATYFYAPNRREGVFLPLAMELTLGFSVALLVNSLCWPYSPRREWDERFRRAWGVCRESCARWFAGGEPEGGVVRRPGPLDRQLEELLGLFHDSIKPVDAADPGLTVRRAAVRCLEEIVFLLQDLRRVGRRAHAADNPAAFARLGRAFDDGFAGLERVLAGGDLPAGFPSAGVEALPSPASGPDALRHENLRRLQATLGACPDAFRALALLPAGESVTQREQILKWTAPFEFADLRQLNAQSWRQGAKVAIVVLAALGTWQALRLPSGGTVLFLALLVMLPDLGRSTRQALDCALGVLLGLVVAFLAVASVVKYVETIFGYGLCVFGVLFVLGYLAGASPRLAYVGFQGAISFVVVFVSSDRQSVSLEPLRERFVALAFGVTIALVVLHNLWPVRKVKAMFKTLAENFARCARDWEKLRQAKREDLSARQEASVQGFNEGLVRAGLLVNTIELEGGEGSPRYGYAGRLLTHQVALFEQMHLFGQGWAELAAADPDLAWRAGEIQVRLQVLAQRLGQPAEPPYADPAPSGEPLPAPPATDENVRREALSQRAGEIEAILASLDRLTGLPSSA